MLRRDVQPSVNHNGEVASYAICVGGKNHLVREISGEHGCRDLRDSGNVSVAEPNAQVAQQADSAVLRVAVYATEHSDSDFTG